jgi:gliding motility-associated-like protein
VVTSNTAAPNANAGADQTINCGAATVILNGASTSAPISFSWAGPGIVSGSSTATPTVNAAGTYTVTVTNTSNGCTATDDVVVINSSAVPNANAGADQILTCSATSVILNGASTSTPVSFSWAGPGIVSGGTTATPTVNAAGTYTVTVTNTSNGCSSTDQAVVTSNTAAPNANAGADATLTCTTASVILNGSSTTTAAEYSWSGPGIVSGGSTATPTVNAGGFYTLTVTDPVNGCTATDQAAVSANITSPVANAGPDQIITCAVPVANLDGTASTPGLSYSWAGAGIVAGANSSSALANASGTFTLTVTDPANGCSSTDQVVVTSNTTAPNANAGPDHALTCAAPSTALEGSSSTSGATFSWTGPGIVTGAATANPVVNAAGTYTVTVTDPANGCTATDEVVVTPPAGAPEADAGTDQTLTCIITSVTLNGTSVISSPAFSWTGPGIVSGASTANPTVDAPGVYTLTVTDTENGCSSSDDVTVFLNNTPPVSNAGADQIITCTMPAVTLDGSASTAGMTYSWTGPGTFTANTQSASATVSGTYTLTVTNPANGCSAADEVVVTPSAGIPDVNAGPDQELTCAITSVSLYGSSSTTGVTFNWIGPAIVAGTTTASPTVNGIGTYTVTVTNTTTGCTATDEVLVTNSVVIPNSNAGPDMVLTCAVTSVTLNGSTTTSAVTYSWSGPGIVSGGTTLTPDVNAAGTYTLSVTNPSTGCIGYDQVIVSVAAGAPAANAGADQTLTCTVTSVNLNGSSSSPGMSYSWSGPGIVSGATTLIPSVNAAGTYTITVTNASNGCTATDDVVVNSNTTAPAATAAPINSSLCKGESTQINSAPAGINYTYAWSPAAGLSNPYIANPVANPSITTLYTLTVTDMTNGCSAPAAFTITVDPIPVPVFISDGISGCAPYCVNFTESSTVTSGSVVGWDWSFGGDGTGTGQTPSHCFVNPGTYSIALTVTSAAGCKATSTAPFVITANPNPEAAFSAPLATSIFSPAIQYTDESTIASPGVISSWSWNFGDNGAKDNVSTLQNPSHTFSAEGEYCAQLTVQSTKGCTSVSNLCIVIEPEFTFFIPNGFTPNDDGINDEFYGVGSFINTYEMLIYDRWGNMIFYTDDQEKHWNGGVNNNSADIVQEDVYVYVVNLTDFKERKHKYIGKVTIVK